jgi:hypothetical protein
MASETQTCAIGILAKSAIRYTQYDIQYNYAKQSQFTKSQMNVSSIITKDYKNKSNWTLSENKPNQSQLAKSQN